MSNPATPLAYRAAPPGDIYAEYEVPTSALSPHSAGTSIIYGPDSFVAKLPGRAQSGEVPVRNITLPDCPTVRRAAARTARASNSEHRARRYRRFSGIPASLR